MGATGFFFFYDKKVRCCTKVITKECPHTLQPLPLDFLMVFDDPSFVDESLNAPYMKEAEERQTVKRSRVEKKFLKKLGVKEDDKDDDKTKKSKEQTPAKEAA